MWAMNERQTGTDATERLEAVLDGLDAAVYAVDTRTDETLFANRAFRSLLGWDPTGRVLRGQVVPFPERGDYRVDPRGVGEDEAPCELFDGDLLQPRSGRWYRVRELAMRWADGRIVRLGIATDITDYKKTAEIARQQEERAARTARLITMGEMASMLAHEINQPLAAIANYCNGCLARIDAGADAGELAPVIRKAASQAERAGKIIQGIREFVKKREPQRAPVSINAIFEMALAFVELDAQRRRIRLVVEVAPGLPQVLADHILIEQVVLNLVRNGFDAMKDSAGDDRMLVVRARLADENCVEVAVIDRGCGIAEADVERLFQPFFTTKNEGMGMGLSICPSIIEFHHGHLDVQYNPEGGTIFVFTLPVEKPARE